MKPDWTFGRKLAAGFAMTVALAVVIGIIGVYALRSVVASKDRVIGVDSQLLVDALRLELSSQRKSSAGRAFLLTREDQFFGRLQAARTEFDEILDRLKRSISVTDTLRLVEAIRRSEAEHHQALEQVMALRRTGAAVDAVARAWEQQVSPKRNRLDENIEAFVSGEQLRMKGATQASSDTASRAVTLVVVITIFVVVFAGWSAFFLSRILGQQIGSAVGHVQSSSAELQAAANQQATGAKEQATAMNEINTTIRELLVTSRQITESAQRVAQIAEETAGAARSGDETVEKAHASIAAISRQVDLVVNHMLELGKKSQQIGTVLDIVSELAEQTNILAINATIEAAGAGETGKRFAVVADEIRKLADRVAGSTKEIRALIDDVRSAVNTTVMATEAGSKAVDAGSKQFGHVAASFRQIAGLVTTTTEAAREIELSTKQQMTAVEQVNVAIANVAQASKETEASSGQTLQTASQLAGLSQNLLRLVRPQAA
jgi:CHASE3 domain sensor protein